MNYVGKVFSSVRGYIGINPATLTGAIDIIVIRQDDGSYVSSPWHVRFGKMGVIRAKQKVVDIEINGEPVDLHMKLGEAGEAFFVEEADIAEVPLHLATSPLQTGGLDLMEKGLLEMKEHSTVDHHSEAATPVIENGGGIGVTMEGNSPVVSVIPKTSLAQSLPESGIFAKVMDNFQRPHYSRMIMSEVSTQTDMSGNDVDLQKCQATGDPLPEQDVRFRNVQSSIELATRRSSLTHDQSDVVRAEPAVFEDPTPRKIFSFDPDAMTTTDDNPQILAITEVDSLHNEMSSQQKSAEMMIKRGSGDGMEDCQFEMELEEEESEVAVFTRRMTVPMLGRNSFESTRMEKRNQFVSIYQSFSDTDLTPVVSPSGSRPSSPKSDTELDVVRNDATSQTHLTGDKLLQMDDLLWKWGQFPETSSSAANCVTKKDDLNKSDTKPAAKMLPSGGIYLDDLQPEEMDPELIGLYLYDNRSPPKAVEDDRESGRGVSLPQSPVTVHMDAHDIMTTDATTANRTIANHDVAMSLCGATAEEDGEAVASKFQQNIISYEALCSNPNVFSDPNLVIRISGKYYKWQVAGPMIMSVVIFNKPLNDRALDNLMKQHMPKKEQRKRWLPWWGGKETAAPLQGSEKLDPSMSKDAAASAPSSQASSPPDTPQKVKDRSRSLVKDNSSITNDTEAISLADEEVKPGDDAKEDIMTGKEIYKKSLKLSSEQIVKLNLNEGANEVTFSVTTQYQGTTRCTCYIFLWNWNDRIIVSDIDGTITKSDVLGQVLPMIGQVLPYKNDWSQVGIAKLYSMIASNGYKFLYLSARAIGQSKITRDYLRSIRQGDVSLPDGPLLLSPSSLASAFHKEVIERKPEEFKISCLKDIKELFPSSINPFIAGFGNRINDVWAYTTIGIPRSRIFTVNHKGQLRIETLQSFESSYTRLSDVSDHFFPPLDAKMQARNLPYEFSTFNYWRNALPDVESELDDFLKKASAEAAAAAADKKQDKKTRPPQKKKQ